LKEETAADSSKEVKSPPMADKISLVGEESF